MNPYVEKLTRARNLILEAENELIKIKSSVLMKSATL